MMESVLVFILTLFLVVFRPFGLGIGYSALAGALVSLLLGVVSLKDVVFVVSLVWDAVISFVLLVFISIVLDKAGFFDWSALRLSMLSMGNGFLLYLYLMLLTALTSALFANDGAMLMLTPVIYAKLRNLGLKSKDMLPYFMGIGFMSESASLPLIVSNLTNIITARYFGLGFWEYALYMSLPYLTSVSLTLLLFWLLNRRSMVRTFDIEALQDKTPRLAVRDPTVFISGWIIIIFLGIAFLFLELLHVELPVSPVLLVASLFLAISTLKNRVVSLREVFMLTPWHIVVFAVSMFVVVYGLKSVGLISLLSYAIQRLYLLGEWEAIIGVGVLASLLSAVFNNLPAVLMVNLGVGESPLTQDMKTFLGLANVVGTNIGQKITPIGSLATLLWLHLLRHKGIRISYIDYIKANTPIATLITLAVLLSLLLVRYVFSSKP